MIKRFFLLLIICGLCLTKTIACDCGYNGSFLKMSKRTPLVALVRVTKYLNFKDIYDSKIPMSMEVEIIDIYKGIETRKTIIVWGDNGNLCRPYLSNFKEGKYYVIAFDNGEYKGGHQNENVTDYSIFDCGCYWLAVDLGKKKAIGDINSEDRKISSIDLKKLKRKLKKNGY